MRLRGYVLKLISRYLRLVRVFFVILIAVSLCCHFARVCLDAVTAAVAAVLPRWSTTRSQHRTLVLENMASMLIVLRHLPTRGGN